MGISKRNPRGNFNWQSRILKRKAICCTVQDVPPTPTANCYCYTITGTAGSCSVSYIDCAGVSQVVTSGRAPIYVCAQENSFQVACLAPANSVDITGGTCVCDGSPAPDPLPPIGVITGPTQGVCGASNVNYSLTATGATSYTWIITGADYESSTNPPVNSTYYIIWGASGGTIEVTASNACGTSDPLIITTSPSCP